MIIDNCDYCGKEKEFKVAEHKRAKNHFCKPECYHLWMKDNKNGRNNPNFNSVLITCEICGKEFYAPKSRIGERRYCTKKCHNKSKTLKEVSKSKVKRYSSDYKTWRADVLENYGHACAICNSKRDLIAHHIISVRENPELIHDVNNGVCWCRSCHSSYHKEKIS